jgi:hypothetical protein
VRLSAARLVWSVELMDWIRKPGPYRQDRTHQGYSPTPLPKPRAQTTVRAGRLHWVGLTRQGRKNGAEPKPDAGGGTGLVQGDKDQAASILRRPPRAASLGQLNSAPSRPEAVCTLAGRGQRMSIRLVEPVEPQH